MFWFLRASSQPSEIQLLSCLSPKTSHSGRQMQMEMVCVPCTEVGDYLEDSQASWVPGLGFDLQIGVQWVDRVNHPLLSSHKAS